LALWFFEKIRIEELLLVLIGPNYFKPLKELAVFMKEPAMNWWLYGQLFEFLKQENYGYIPEPTF